jgi:DNA-binding Xre family transcriptional regulator
MGIILGEIIRRAIRDDDRSAKEICDVLGMSRGNLDKIYKKDSINTDLLALLCTTLNHDFFQYVNPFVLAEREQSVFYNVEDGLGQYRSPINRLNRCMIELHDTQKDLDHLDRQIALIKTQLSDKDKIISLQSDKIDQLQQKLRDCNAAG